MMLHPHPRTRGGVRWCLPGPEALSAGSMGPWWTGGGGREGKAGSPNAERQKCAGNLVYEKYQAQMSAGLSGRLEHIASSVMVL